MRIQIIHSVPHKSNLKMAQFLRKRACVFFTMNCTAVWLRYSTGVAHIHADAKERERARIFEPIHYSLCRELYTLIYCPTSTITSELQLMAGLSACSFRSVPRRSACEHKHVRVCGLCLYNVYLPTMAISRHNVSSSSSSSRIRTVMTTATTDATSDCMTFLLT